MYLHWPSEVKTVQLRIFDNSYDSKSFHNLDYFFINVDFSSIDTYYRFKNCWSDYIHENSIDPSVK